MIPDFYVLVFLFCHFSKVANLIIKFAFDICSPQISQKRKLVEMASFLLFQIRLVLKCYHYQSDSIFFYISVIKNKSAI